MLEISFCAALRALSLNQSLSEKRMHCQVAACTRRSGKLDKLTRAFSILMNFPGLDPTAFAHKMWPASKQMVRAGMMGSSYMRKLKKDGYVLIRYAETKPPYVRYRSVLRYYLSDKGYEIANILTGREQITTETQVSN